jgi:hypothetical protein
MGLGSANNERNVSVSNFSKNKLARLVEALGVLLTAAFVTAGAAAAAPSVDETELTSLGFKTLVATTKVQQDWVRGLQPGKIRAVQRTGKKFFIYPDASNNRIYVGGPAEYESYRKLHPEQQSTQDLAKTESAYRAKQATAMSAATARDLSDPFLGASWADLGW